MLTNKELKALLGVAYAAPKGPWQATYTGRGVTCHIRDKDWGLVTSLTTKGGKRNIRYLRTFHPELVIELLEEVERLRKQLEGAAGLGVWNK